MSVRDSLRARWEAAVTAALPDGKFAGALPERAAGRTVVLGAGKAAARMATAFEDTWGSCEGLVVTRYGHATPTRFIEVVKADHPVPDDAGVAATHRIMELTRSTGADDLVVFLISGGASALLVSPIASLSLQDKQDINQRLLRSGIPIAAVNEVRRCVSVVKGGKLAELAAPARIVTYLISDVPGDAPDEVGSGPTISSATDPRRALALLRQYDVEISPKVAAAIARFEISTTPPSDSAIVHILATPMMALEAAAAARRCGMAPVILGDAIEGEARDVSLAIGGIARSIAAHGHPARPPCVLLSGGETTARAAEVATPSSSSACSARSRAWKAVSRRPPTTRTGSTDWSQMREVCSMRRRLAVPSRSGSTPLHSSRATMLTTSSPRPATSRLPVRQTPTSTTSEPSPFDDRLADSRRTRAKPLIQLRGSRNKKGNGNT